MSNLVNPDEVEIVIKCKTRQNYMMLANALRMEQIPFIGIMTLAGYAYGIKFRVDNV